MSVVTCFILAVVMSAGNEEFERMAVRGAAEIIVARIRAETVAEPSVTGVLVRAMTADPARYATRAGALEAGASVYAESVGASFRGRVDAALVELAGTRTPEEVFGTNFVHAARMLSDAERARILSGPYTNAFARERRTVCEAQAQMLVASVRPSIAAVDSDDERKIRETLCANIARASGRVVFEENRDYISQNLVGPILEDARREKRRQQEYVRRVRSEARAPSALTRDISRKLEENVRERAAKSENSALRWEIFPSVTNKSLAAAVELRVTGRLADKVAEAKLDVSSESVAQAITAGGESSRTASASRTALRTVTGTKLLSDATAAAVSEAETSERDELAKFLAARRAAPAVGKAVETRLSNELDPVIRRVRAEMAARAFEKLWPSLADRTWYPTAELADDVSARSDYAAAVKRWRKLPGLGELNRRAPLEEADQKADLAVKDAFELARAAVVGQTKVVDEVKPSVLAESRDRKESFFRRTPDLKAIVGMLSEATLERWAETKNAVLWSEAELPQNAADQHAELFPSVKKRIELVAKEIYEEMEKSEPEEKPETPPVETPPEDLKLEYAILVSRAGERVSVKLEQSGRSVVSRETDAKLAPFKSAMKEVADKLGAQILNLK